MENLDINNIILLVVGTVIGILVPLAIKFGAKLLGKVKASETEIDDQIVLKLAEEALKNGVISQELADKIKDELA